MCALGRPRQQAARPPGLGKGHHLWAGPATSQAARYLRHAPAPLATGTAQESSWRCSTGDRKAAAGEGTEGPGKQAGALFPTLCAAAPPRQGLLPQISGCSSLVSTEDQGARCALTRGGSGGAGLSADEAAGYRAGKTGHVTAGGLPAGERRAGARGRDDEAVARLRAHGARSRNAMRAQPLWRAGRRRWLMGVMAVAAGPIGCGEHRTSPQKHGVRTTARPP